MSISVFERFGLVFSLLPSILGISTIFACYSNTIYVGKHLPDWLWMPVISLLGSKNPEQIISTLLFYYAFDYTILQYIGVNEI